jgi:hypothetical protein
MSSFAKILIKSIKNHQRLFRCGYYVSVGRDGEFSYMGLTGDDWLLSISNSSPIGSLFISPLALVSGLDPWVLCYFLPVFFSIMFISGMFLFYRAFMNREKLLLVTFLSSLIPYFGYFQVSHFPIICAFALCLSTFSC